MPHNALKSIFTEILPCKADISYQQLRLENIEFVSKWDKIKVKCTNKYNLQQKSFADT